MERVAPRFGLGAGQPREKARGECLEQHAGHAVPEPHPVALGGVVQQGGDHDVGVIVIRGDESSRHVQGVTTIRDRHGIEKGDGLGGQQPTSDLLLVGTHPSPHMGHELSDPMHR